ncbi:Hint domain-containing protein [Pseudobacteriovorax antillogorgiicola]|uniref:Intein N-terminal splicing region n=1 Tax=Pseudobacteriovorax antillogorgiicola TaxID=1513793 RepID=A0A1Y6CEN0_9BACT|nr:Hint domain-containing protein [Pseudobacteriovorax antillogorgiicola]TCS47587.1 intein [Pseudobacteriovorax antillogorgiicola]SMF60274.1 intein N-terminal splicing region [Pseudobacteriovorax antillogorgiicola]
MFSIFRSEEGSSTVFGLMAALFASGYMLMQVSETQKESQMVRQARASQDKGQNNLSALAVVRTLFHHQVDDKPILYLKDYFNPSEARLELNAKSKAKISLNKGQEILLKTKDVSDVEVEAFDELFESGSEKKLDQIQTEADLIVPEMYPGTSLVTGIHFKSKTVTEDVQSAIHAFVPIPAPPVPNCSVTILDQTPEEIKARITLTGIVANARAELLMGSQMESKLVAANTGQYGETQTYTTTFENPGTGDFTVTVRAQGVGRLDSEGNYQADLPGTCSETGTIQFSVAENCGQNIAPMEFPQPQGCSAAMPCGTQAANTPFHHDYHLKYGLGVAPKLFTNAEIAAGYRVCFQHSLYGSQAAIEAAVIKSGDMSIAQNQAIYAVQNCENKGFIQCRNNIGCFDPETKIRLADGKETVITELKKGDLVYNPITQRSYPVKRLIVGPERKPMRVISYQGKQVKVTLNHPFPTRSGTKMARDLTLNDEIAIRPGIWGKIEVLKTLAPTDDQVVWNLELDGPEDHQHHWVLANGVTSGDFKVQQDLEAMKPRFVSR